MIWAEIIFEIICFNSIVYVISYFVLSKLADKPNTVMNNMDQWFVAVF